jgi:hypothetical protein
MINDTNRDSGGVIRILVTGIRMSNRANFLHLMAPKPRQIALVEKKVFLCECVIPALGTCHMIRAPIHDQTGFWCILAEARTRVQSLHAQPTHHENQKPEEGCENTRDEMHALTHPVLPFLSSPPPEEEAVSKDPVKNTNTSIQKERRIKERKNRKEL